MHHVCYLHVADNSQTEGEVNIIDTTYIPRSDTSTNGTAVRNNICDGILCYSTCNSYY